MSLLTWIYGDQANADAAAAADAKLNASNQQLYGVGYVMKQNQPGTIYNVDPWVPPAQQDTQVNTAFQEGAAQGASNISSTISGAFNFVGKGLSAVLLGIPFWVWVLVIGGAWVYLGMPGLGHLAGAGKSAGNKLKSKFA